MQTIFDWLALSSSGPELLSTMFTLRVIEPGDFENEPGTPMSALSALCPRCQCFSAQHAHGGYCRTCAHILEKKRIFVPIIKEVALIWGYVGFIPAPVLELCDSKVGVISPFLTNLLQPFCYLPDPHHFLVALRNFQLQPWLQELVFAHGKNLQGNLQIFSTRGSRRFKQMGDLLSSVRGLENNQPLEPMHIRFYPDSATIFQSTQAIEAKSLLSDITQFLSLLELVKSFKTLFDPRMQDQIFQILKLTDRREKKFFWGRFLGQISVKAREFLDSYAFDQWSRAKITLFFSLISYVPFNRKN